MRDVLKKVIAAVLIFAAVASTSVNMDMTAYATTYTAMQDVYYTKDNCVVYSQPSYTSTVLTTIGANIPVQVIGAYSNGWYRINIGVICYVKMDSVSPAGAIGISIKNSTNSQIADAQKTAAEIGYEFVNVTLNKQKTIKKDFFNSYIGRKVILYAKIDNDLGVSFKMLYEDKITRDIDLNATKTVVNNSLGGRRITYSFNNPATLKGQLAIFQFNTGYDKAFFISAWDIQNGGFWDMCKFDTNGNRLPYYLTEFSEFAYVPMTQVADMDVEDVEVAYSLTDEERKKMADLRYGVKYLADDNPNYRNNVVSSRLRKDTEYVDYKLK